MLQQSAGRKRVDSEEHLESGRLRRARVQQMALVYAISTEWIKAQESMRVVSMVHRRRLLD